MRTVTKTGKRKTSYPVSIRGRRIHSRKAGKTLHSKSTTASEVVFEEMIPDPFDLTDTDAQSYLKTAPDLLKKLHRRLQGSGYKPLLGALLRDPRMKNAWREIEKRLSELSIRQRGSRQEELSRPWKELAYEKLGRTILVAKSRSARPLEPRSRIRERFNLIALDAMALAEAIGDSPLITPSEVEAIRKRSRRKLSQAIPYAQKPLDLLAYEFFPENIAALTFRKTGWSKLDSETKSDIATRILFHWPSMTDLLTELARRAALEAGKLAATPRIVDRKKNHLRRNLFIRHLYKDFFRPVLNGSMPGTLARIASVVLGEEISQELVKAALRHITK